jgi:hypothetical protein
MTMACTQSIHDVPRPSARLPHTFTHLEAAIALVFTTQCICILGAICVGGPRGRCADAVGGREWGCWRWGYPLASLTSPKLGPHEDTAIGFNSYGPNFSYMTIACTMNRL